MEKIISLEKIMQLKDNLMTIYFVVLFYTSGANVKGSSSKLLNARAIQCGLLCNCIFYFFIGVVIVFPLTFSLLHMLIPFDIYVDTR